MSKTWEQTQKAVCAAMREHSAPMTVALSRILSNDSGTACGTGTYLSLLGKTYVLTNEHVAEFTARGGLAHFVRDGECAHRLIHPFISMGEPVDAAISRVDDESWANTSKRALPALRIDHSHRTAQHELLFINGFPGERSRWSALADGLVSTSVPYLTQEAPLPPGLDPAIHFALHYSPEHAKSVDGRNALLPQPRGFSGSLVWNTHFLEAASNEWVPEQATATGLVCLWPQGQFANLILAVRIEVVRALILKALREESAYFSWLTRGSPTDSALYDWSVAERAIPDLR